MVEHLGQQGFHYDVKELLEAITNSIKDASEDVTGTMMENSNENKALTTWNNKLLKLMNDRGIVASYLLSLFYKITNPEITSQFKLVRDSNSKRVKHSLLHNIIPVILSDIFSIFQDTNEEFESQGDLLKMVINKNYNVDLANLQDKKLKYDLAREMNFDVKAPGNKYTWVRRLIRLLKSPGLMITASDVPNTNNLLTNHNESCNRLKLFLQEKQVDSKSGIIFEKIVSLIDILIE